MKALVFTASSLFQLSRFSIPKEWFLSYDLPDLDAGLKRVVVDNIVYIIENSLENDDDPLVVINLVGPNPVFSEGRDNTLLLERIITVARAAFTTSVKIPPTWRPYRENSLLSVNAASRIKGRGSRVSINLRPNNISDVFVFAFSDEAVAFSDLPHLDLLHLEARTKFIDAILAPSMANPGSARSGIVLEERSSKGFVQGATLAQWYSSKLTANQQRFVDKPYDGPVRLRGVAGTGKTLSLIIKILRDGARFEATQQAVKLCFITHSTASVDFVSAMAEGLDTLGLITGRGEFCKIEVRTLYDLAHEHLHFELDNLQPLSLDGREGRVLQAELISSALREMRGSTILQARFSDIAPTLKAQWESMDDNDSEDCTLVTELMNEFSSVLDAESIRIGEERGERYAKATIKRPAWLMTLESEIDRRFVLEIHRRYRAHLSEMNTLSVDQMVADFNTYLDSNRWDRVRDRSGYDALFVDELHLFTATERQTLHRLIKRGLDDRGLVKRPPIFMAYDLKQSPRDSFTQSEETGSQFFAATTGLRNSELVELDTVFRYTPQITEFLTDLDAAFPAIDIPGEWEAYAGTAKLGAGPLPELHVFRDDRTLFETVFDDAGRCARAIQGGGKRIAVLCSSEAVFDRYLLIAAGRYEGKVLAITSREPATGLQHAGKRFIFSMPEYVAGLQFDTVFLIHADATEAPPSSSIGARRRFISNIYLGSSRAEKTLRISSSLARGGKSDIFDMALKRGSLLEV
jgi:hypothetical protein